MIKNILNISHSEKTERGKISSSSMIASIVIGGKTGWKAAYTLYRYDIRYGTSFRNHPELYEHINKYVKTFPRRIKEDFIDVDIYPQQGIDRVEQLQMEFNEIRRKFTRYKYIYKLPWYLRIFHWLEVCQLEKWVQYQFEKQKPEIDVK